MNTIGLIAGNRKFPLIFAQAAKSKGYYVVAFAVRGDTSGRIKDYAHKVVWLRVSEFSRLGEIMRAEGVTKAVMAGQISPWRLFSSELRRDPQLNALLEGIKDKRADSIFAAIIGYLEKSGIEFLDSTLFLEGLLPAKGVLTVSGPNAAQSEDINFGFKLAKEVSGLDIGQTVAVKDKAIVGIEAFEGTDNLIRRSGRLAGRGITVVKVSKPRQDPRFDIPVIGLNTVKTLLNAGAACLAIEAGKTLFIDREASLRLADKKGLVIAAV